MLGRRHVQASVLSSLTELMVEGTFPTGTYLVTVHNPIASDDGNLGRALYGSFLPIPSNDLFPLPDPSVYEHERQPGAVRVVRNGKVKLREGGRRVRLKVTSKGDRPIQVRYYRFAGTKLMNLDRKPLPFHRNKSAARFRSHQGVWILPRYPGRYLGKI